MSNDFFISIDWGTSNFRLRLAEKSSLQIKEEIINATGVKTLYSKWQQQSGNRELIFLNFLKQQIAQLQTVIPSDIEIVISGMASSGIGIRELPYDTLPFQVNGKDLYVEHISHSLFPQGIKLISGVRSDSDVMRGEEVQIIGLADEDDVEGITVFILPGTHSKHLFCKDEKIIHFNTFMTGEMFEVISSHSILKNSIEKSDPDPINLKAFDEGVQRSKAGLSILNDLFKIRAADLLCSKPAKENYYYLSGLLIGEELAALQSQSFDQIRLCAGNNLHKLYVRAINTLEPAGKTKVIAPQIVETAVVKGHARILKQYNAF